MMHRTIKLFLVIFIAFAALGCKKAETSAGATEPEQPEPASEEAPDEPDEGPTPDAPDDGTAEPAESNADVPATAEKSEHVYTVKLETTKGDIIIDVHRDWAPLGAERFRELVESGFYDNVAFFRVIEGFMAQAGLSGTPRLNAKWQKRPLMDDPLKRRNTRATVTFAMAGLNSRTTQFFINLVDNPQLDPAGFSPFGQVRDMAVVETLYSGYGEGAPNGKGPKQGKLAKKGNKFLKKKFPDLDYILSATIIEE
jgi:peptidyl-prolyl cis-trans isomerase A (cyclophilin A)